MNPIYEKITSLFQKEMIKELAANSRKGDRDGWLSCDPMQLVIEVYYHNGKLQEAVKNNDLDKIREYATDVANMSMMILDRCGGLLPIEYVPTKKLNTEWTEDIIKENL